MTIQKRSREPGKPKLARASLLFLVLGTGCLSQPTPDKEGSSSSGEDKASVEPAAIPPSSPAPEASKSNAPAAPASPATVSMTLAEAVQAALEHNPSLLVIRQGERVSQAALEVAQAYPFNPKLGLDVRPWTRESNGARDEVLVAASILQEIELAGQGGYREQAGAADLDRTRQDIPQAELGT